MLSAEDWTLQEAVDLRSDDPVGSVERPLLDWYAEYVRQGPTNSELVRVSGHAASSEETRAELEEVGFAFADIDVDGWSAVGGSATADPAGPALLILDHGATSLVVLSYELGVPELAAVTGDLEPVDQASWVDAGGVAR